MNEYQPLLALDIGTRKVAGVVAHRQGPGLKVLATRVLEHADRAMIDGQVHKIEAVAQVVARVKADLEAATGLVFKEAAVAAAGRALLTESAPQSQRFAHATEITDEILRALEYQAARSAQAALVGRENLTHLHCVGFSTIRTTLDGDVLDHPAGHRGQEIATTVLATFLPRQVVDSLISVLRRTGLTARSLTLEPIAALEATIPKDLRRMNLALVDIGAGTSDIALTRDGSVFAYAMVTQAGDEITECLCDHYLLEFNEGERVKRRVEDESAQPVEMTTILGQTIQAGAEELRRALAPAVDKLAQAIAIAIRNLNGDSPRAVILVGGGSATPGLGPCLAAHLGIDANRVGVRAPALNPDIDNPTQSLGGVEGTTPIGIALTALRGQGLSFQASRVNGEIVQMLAFSHQLTVCDALLASGLNIKRIYPRLGAAITYTLDGQLRSQAGTMGEPARIILNGKPATLDTELNEGSDVTVIPGRDGEPAALLPEQIKAPQGPAWFLLNTEHRDMELELHINGQPAVMGQPIPDRAELCWVSRLTLEEYLPALKSLRRGATLSVKVNGQERRIQGPAPVLKANGHPVDGTYRPRINDKIEWAPTPAGELSLQEVVGEMTPAHAITVIVNGQRRTLDAGGGSRILVNGKPAVKGEPIPDRAEITIESRAAEPPILSHVLEGLNLHPPKDAGPLKLRVDGQEASFITPLRDGAHVEISFG